MYEFDKSKLNVSYKNWTSNKLSIDDRKYTLTHSDDTGDLYLTISDEYDYSKIDKIRDEVLGKWVCEDGKYHLELSVLVGMDGSLERTKRRDMVFRRELHLAIKSIIYGDMDFLKENNINEDTEIIVNFNSKLEEYNTVEMIGILKDYIK